MSVGMKAKEINVIVMLQTVDAGVLRVVLAAILLVRGVEQRYEDWSRWPFRRKEKEYFKVDVVAGGGVVLGFE